MLGMELGYKHQHEETMPQAAHHYKFAAGSGQATLPMGIALPPELNHGDDDKVPGGRAKCVESMAWQEPGLRLTHILLQQICSDVWLILFATR